MTQHLIIETQFWKILLDVINDIENVIECYIKGLEKVYGRRIAGASIMQILFKISGYVSSLFWIQVGVSGTDPEFQLPKELIAGLNNLNEASLESWFDCLQAHCYAYNPLDDAYDFTSLRDKIIRDFKKTWPLSELPSKGDLIGIIKNGRHLSGELYHNWSLKTPITLLRYKEQASLGKIIDVGGKKHIVDNLCRMTVYFSLYVNQFAESLVTNQKTTDLLKFGIDYFNVKIGHYGIIPLILAHIYHLFQHTESVDEEPGSVCLHTRYNSNWQSHDDQINGGNRYMIRFIRTSMMLFAKYVNRRCNRSYNYNKGNYKNRDCCDDNDDDCKYILFWKAFTLIMCGKYSFSYTNCDLFTNTDSISCIAIADKSSSIDIIQYILKKSRLISKLQVYLKKFVISPIESGLMAWTDTNMSKYAHVHESYSILKFCFFILGDKKRFNHYKTLSTKVTWWLNTIWSCVITPAEEQSMLSLMRNFVEDNKYFVKLTQNPLTRQIGIDNMDIIVNGIRKLNDILRVCKFGRLMEMIYSDDNIDIAHEIHKHANNQFQRWKNNVINQDSHQNHFLMQWKNLTCIKYCNYCRNNENKLKKCKQCNKVYYCCRLCQKRDWNQHSKHCN